MDQGVADKERADGWTKRKSYVGHACEPRKYVSARAVGGAVGDVSRDCGLEGCLATQNSLCNGCKEEELVTVARKR